VPEGARVRRHGADNPRIANALSQLGRSLLQQRRCAEAEPILRECLAIREKVAPRNWRMFEAKALLGGALLGQKKYADAEPLLLAGYRGMSGRAVRMLPAAEGPGRLHEALDWLIELAEARADKDAAARWRKERGTGGRE
jgi:eukaryotic-like serine/threonine-protein kinase